jgi:hypothetical protein
MKKLLTLFICCFPLFIYALPPSGNIDKVITLQYQPADKIKQLIQPVLKPGDKVSASGQTLVVSVQPSTLTAIREIIHNLDIPPVTFMISIFQGPANQLPPSNGQFRQVISTQSRDQQQQYQSVRVDNGNAAYISTGNEKPYVAAVGAGWFNLGVAYERKQVNKSFFVRPELQGSQVRLQLYRVRDNVNRVNNEQIRQQRAETTMTVPLNKWVVLGSAQGQPPAQPNTMSIQVGNPNDVNSTIYIKVEKVGASFGDDAK